MNTASEFAKLRREIESLNRRVSGARETNVDAAMVGRVLNGSTLRAIVLTITEAAGVVTANLSSSVGNTIVMKFNDGFVDVDVTAPITVVITHGTDIGPTLNYLYVLASDPTTLVKSIVGFPVVEHLRCAKIFCQSAASAGNDGCYKEHIYRDDIFDTEYGHIGAINHWVREQWAHWEKGVAPTFSGTGGAAIGYASTAGIVGQLHDNVFPAFADPADVYAINDPDTSYRKITNIALLLKDSAGIDLKNKTYGLVFWGVTNDNGESKIFCNLPSGSEIGEKNARQDKDIHINYGIPAEFRGVGFLIYRLIIKNNNDTTWDLYLAGAGDDLRGQVPATSAGSTTAIGINFPDGASGFTLFNATDITKEVQFDLSGITTGNTRTVTFPDRNLDLGNPIFDSITSLGNVHLDANSAELRLGAEVNDYTIKWDGSDAVHTVVAGDFAFIGGNIAVGHRAPLGAIHVLGTDMFSDRITGDAFGLTWNFRKARAGPSIVFDGDDLMVLRGWGWDGSSYEFAGEIQIRVDGTPIDGASMPGMITFSTTLAGTLGLIERMRIDNTGGIFAYNLKSGANQGAAGAAIDELWQDTNDNTIKIGV